MRKLKLFAAMSMLVVGGLFGLMSVSPSVSYAQADVLKEACSSSEANSSPTCQPDAGNNPLTGKDGLLLRVSRIIAVAAGVAAVVLISVSGFRYITSEGDTQKIATAKKTLIGTIVGLVIIGLAEIIIEFVLKGLF